MARFARRYSVWLIAIALIFLLPWIMPGGAARTVLSQIGVAIVHRKAEVLFETEFLEALNSVDDQKDAASAVAGGSIFRTSIHFLCDFVDGIRDVTSRHDRKIVRQIFFQRLKQLALR